MKHLKLFEEFTKIGPASDSEIEYSPIKLKKNTKYRIEKDGEKMEFYVMTINEDDNEIYIKVVYPTSYHMGISLSPLLELKPVEVTE